MAKVSNIVVFDNLNVKGIQAFYGPMVNDNVMGMITNITQYQVTLKAVFTVFVNTSISLIYQSVHLLVISAALSHAEVYRQLNPLRLSP
jgi:hypothetical protein